MSKTSLVTGVVINFRTPQLSHNAVASFRNRYPAVPVLLIDNGSNDDSVQMLERFKIESPHLIDVIFNTRNLHHGPAMDQALRYLQTPYVLFLDSDCEVRNGGLIESMLTLMEERADRYAIGKLVHMNKRGFDVEEDPHAYPYIRPICMMVRRTQYLNLPPFERHGTPCLENMRAAVQRGLLLVDFPVEEFIHHQGRGTAGEHGYRLGLRGKWNHLMNKIGL